MQWKNVKLIYLREMRDQLRDRRTLFLIAVLPLLLYPLLGMSFFQLSQFLQHHAAKVLVLGASEVKDVDWLPRLIDGEYFAVELFDDPLQQKNLQLVEPDAFPELDFRSEDPTTIETATRRLLDEGRVEAVVQFPSHFSERLKGIRNSMVERNAEPAGAMPELPILYSAANEKSQLTQLRTDQVLRRWRNAVTEGNLVASDVPMEATRPFEVQLHDVALERQRHAAVWSKVLPFIVFIWALTGAFYPAVDLCAGEKERGTLETLLTSPALRREIVWGKLLTVMTFSTVTALLNLSSLGVTGKFVIDQLSQVGNFGDQNPLSMPPVSALAWLAVALIPISALFSALCLACAAFARSTKEGQYYLMPLMLVSMPLMLLPMSPGVELNLGNSLVPLTGMVLLLRSVIEGQYHLAWPFVAPVALVTLLCCLLAIRWAEEQFSRESVLFRESERLDLRRWLIHVVRDRGETPSFTQSMLCFAVILVVQFFISIALSSQQPGEMTFAFLAQMLLISQLACIFAPAAIMTVMLTRNPRRTLLLERLPRASHLLAAAALAVVMHPVSVQFTQMIAQMYPVQSEVLGGMKAIESAVAGAPSWWAILGLMALLPAVCEELAMRGFILSGLRHLGHKWWAIAISAVAFGAVHMFLQQKISAAAVGLVIGFIAVQTGNLIPCIVFHAIHNSLALSVPRWAESVQTSNQDGLLAHLLGGEQPLAYHPATVVACGVVASALLWWFHGLTYRRTAEEQLEETRQRQDSPLVGA
jgi:sodium transport system permease protein